MVSDNTKSKAQLLDEIQTLRIELGKIQSLFPIVISSLADYSVLYVNNVASRFFDIPLDKAVNLNARDFWYDNAEAQKFIKRLKEKGRISDFETCLLTGNGDKRYVLLSAYLTTFKNTEATHVAITDITQKKKIEQALQKSRKRHRDLANLMALMTDTMPDLIWAKDLKNRYLFANRALCRKLLMCEPGESPLGKTDLFFAERERERGFDHTFGEICINSDEVVKLSGKPGEFLEDGLVRGEYLALGVHKAPLLGEAGKLIGTVGAAHDVTHDLATQNELRRSEALYRLLADNVRDVIWTTDDRLNITYTTPSIQTLTGYSADEFMGVAAEDHFAPQFKKLFRVISRYLLKEARRKHLQPRLWEFKLQHKNGHFIWVETSTSAIYDEEDKFAGFVCATRETTTRVEAQNELTKAKEEALSASKAKSEFLANMSHEIRTPMNGVLGMLQLLQKTPLHPEQADYVRTALSSGQSLLKIISDILDFSKIEAGKIDLEEHQFSLRPTIESIVASFENLINHEQVSLVTDIEEGLPPYIVGDEIRLRQILFNLIGNAIKFTTKGTITVKLSCFSIADKIRLNFSVIDSGIGIRSEKIPSLFDPFVQADGSFRRRYSGTGLGLSIVKRLVELMGGEIRIQSKMGLGSSIYFHIFVKPGRPEEVVATVEEVQPQVNSRSKRILVVEDENINAMVVSAMLEKSGYTAKVVDNGYKALDILKKERFDCILMDIQMPQMDGTETARAIRQSTCKDCSNIPIIALTAHAMKGDRERFLAAGMNDYLTKPVEIDDLNRILRKYSALEPVTS